MGGRDGEWVIGGTFVIYKSAQVSLHGLCCRYNHSAAAMQDKLYVVGGRATSSCYSLRGDGEMYNPSTNQWTMLSPVRCIDGIGNAALASLDGKYFVRMSMTTCIVQSDSME